MSVTREFEHQILAALTTAVPGFIYAYTHSAEFNATMHAEIEIMAMRVELMTLGAQSKMQQQSDEIARLERRIPQPMTIIPKPEEFVKNLGWPEEKK